MRLKLLLTLSFVTFSTASIAASDAPRWYTPQIQQQGTKVFQNNCAVCHGSKAESIPNWKQPNEQGQYPPPPLDGSAHAWHHSLDSLRKTVHDGGQKIGGLMPPFNKTLSAAERDSAIAFFQSQWGDELYEKWSANFKVKPVVLEKMPNPILKRLTTRLNAPVEGEVKKIANDQLYQVKVKGQKIYLTKDGRFALIGKLIDLDTGKEISK